MPMARSLKQTMRFLAGLALGLALAACGGGGGGSSTTSSNSAGTVTTLSGGPASLTDSNVVQVVVESGPGNNVNIPYVSVTVCQPGTSSCKTIDHVLVDTGSVGLRLFASQLSAAPALSLPAQTAGASVVISECAQFLNNLTWGPVKLADVRLGGELAASVPVQLIDASYATVPLACNSQPVVSTPGNINANGILGVGLFASDRQTYFNCNPPTAACPALASTALTAQQQVQNPVTRFSVNNNGVILHLPALTDSGSTRAEGLLIFGVGTQANNALDTAQVVPMNSSGVFFNTSYSAHSYTQSVFDSGSNGLFFDDYTLPVCGGSLSNFYCPSSTQSLSGTLPAAGAISLPVTVANTRTLFSANGASFAFNSLAGSNTDRTQSNSGIVGAFFDWGLPVYFGRSVYTLVEGKSVTRNGTVYVGPLSAISR